LELKIMKISKIASRPLAVAFGGLVAMVALVALPVAAHHSTAAFDNTRVVRIDDGCQRACESGLEAIVASGR
jgi:hypothetical protein